MSGDTGEMDFTVVRLGKPLVTLAEDFTSSDGAILLSAGELNPGGAGVDARYGYSLSPAVGALTGNTSPPHTNRITLIGGGRTATDDANNFMIKYQGQPSSGSLYMRYDPLNGSDLFWSVDYTAGSYRGQTGYFRTANCPAAGVYNASSGLPVGTIYVYEDAQYRRLISMLTRKPVDKPIQAAKVVNKPRRGDLILSEPPRIVRPRRINVNRAIAGFDHVRVGGQAPTRRTFAGDIFTPPLTQLDLAEIDKLQYWWDQGQTLALAEDVFTFDAQGGVTHSMRALGGQVIERVEVLPEMGIAGIPMGGRFRIELVSTAAETLTV